MHLAQMEDLLLQSLEHEIGGVKIYSAAIQCAANPALKRDWEKYLAETKTHVVALELMCKGLGLDPSKETPTRAVARHLSRALVDSMEMARFTTSPEAAQIVACQCIVFAETQDHLNWELIAKCAEYLPDVRGQLVQSGAELIEDQEDEHLYHSKGWCRELWMYALGLNALLPPPEEIQNARTAIAAAKAGELAERMR